MNSKSGKNEFSVCSKKLGNTTVHIEATVGTVLDADTQTVSDTYTNETRRGISISTDVYQQTSMWLKLDNGRELELSAKANSVNARVGHRIAVLSIANDEGYGWDDVARVNLTTGKSSTRSGLKLQDRMEKLTGASPHGGAICLGAIAGAVAGAWFFDGEAAIFAFFGFGFLALMVTGWTLGAKCNEHTSEIGKMLKTALSKLENAGPEASADSFSADPA